MPPAPAKGPVAENAARGGNAAPGDGAPQHLIVKLRPSITSNDRDIAGKRIVVLHDEECGKFYHLGCEESVFATLVDGKLTVAEITSQMQMLGMGWNDNDIKAFVSLLIKSNIASVVSVDGKPVPPANTRDATPPPPLLQRVSATLGLMLSQRLPLGNADLLASRLLPCLRPFLTVPGLVVWFFGISVAFWIAWGLSAEITDQCRQMFSPASLPLLACVGVLAKVTHELGHAVTAKRHGVRVGNVGITFFLMAPLAYVDLTNAWKLVPRWSRMQIALGGVYFESWLAISATFLFAWLDDGLARHIAAQVMLIAGPATWVTNANPLLRLDGYYVVSDATSIPNLRMHGRKICSSIIDQWVLRKPTHGSHLTGWRAPFAAAHAAASMMFQCVWMSGIVVAVYYWASAMGAVLACVAVIAWVVMPIVTWWLRNWNAEPKDSSVGKLTRRRMLSVASFVPLVVSMVLSARNPLAHGVPVLVQHHNEQIGRASTDGFVTAVMVHGNQQVLKGELLMEITDEKLLLRRQQMSDELLVNQAKYRQLQSSGHLGDAAAANENVKQLRVSIAELDQSIAAMRIVAIRDGVVVSEEPGKWLGRYAKRGDVLIRVADPDDKELLVAIEEGEFSSYNAAVKRGRPLESRIRGGSCVLVEPTAAQPRFSHTLPHPALSATAGGDVTVIPDAKSKEGAKAAVPIGTAIAVIPPTQSLTLFAGQRGTLYLDDDQTIYARLKHWLIKDYQ